MKSRWILAFLLAAPSPALAQHVRLSVGATFASPSDLNEAHDQSSSDIGYHFGGDIRFGNFLSVAPGVHWQQLRFTLKEDPGKSDGIALNGIQVPVMVGLGIDLKVVDARIYAGPTVTFLTKVGGNDYQLEKSDFKSTSFGGQIGASLDVLFLAVDVSYEAPFTQLFEQDTPYGKGKLGVTRIGLAVRF